MKTRHARRRTLLAAAMLTLAAALLPPSQALAEQDLLSGGSVTLQLKKSKGLKLKPGSLTLQISKGMVDPVTGAGNVNAAGTLRVKSSRGKAKVRITKLTFGASGAPGQIDAKVGKKEIRGFANLRGGTTTRQGFGADLTGITATLGKRGAKALSKGKGKKKRGGASAAAKKGGKVKPGLPLGTVSATTVPKTVEVLPGGSMTLHTDPALVTKLLAHCINGLPGMGGVYPLPPATQDPVTAAFTFPVTGGAMAPDFTDGKVLTGGGQGLTKNVGLAACIAAPPAGTTVLQTVLQPLFATNTLGGEALLPGGVQLSAPVGDINFGTGTRSVDPVTKKVTITGATVTLNALAAITLNNVFPNVSGMASQDFTAADLLGTLDLTATLR